MTPTTRRVARALGMAVATAAAAAVALATAGSAGATPGPDATNRTGRTSIGSVGASGVPRLSTVTAQALPSVTCRAAEGFSRITSGPLFRLSDSAPLGGANTMTELAQVGNGWTGSNFAWTAAGGDGAFYGLTWAGELKWYRYNAGTSSWRTGAGSIVGKGFIPKKKIINISLGGDGKFYVVFATGDLYLFQHTGRLTGAATWASAAGWKIGSGWTGSEIIIPNGDGTVYRQYQGVLYWYRHSDPALGAVTWQRKTAIGSGWKFYDVLSAGAGVLYATEGGTGQVRVYRHADPVGGTGVWATSQGVLKLTARPDSFGIGIDPLACSIV
ncbi:MAG: hypothetical protein IPJ14_13730 [Kineosporiaceae bacterium]|nr:hypothetical protein [Kineosporiaceae bacterium]MBK7623684.1 hypothetical protein [Kineosporiaceae bacterium]MBK8078029.1 hypothetical protein [Kineosporiaceae bacterium]